MPHPVKVLVMIIPVINITETMWKRESYKLSLQHRSKIIPTFLQIILTRRIKNANNCLGKQKTKLKLKDLKGALDRGSTYPDLSHKRTFQNKRELWEHHYLEILIQSAWIIVKNLQDLLMTT
jgi:hypothetical protein